MLSSRRRKGAGGADGHVRESEQLRPSEQVVGQRGEHGPRCVGVEVPGGEVRHMAAGATNAAISRRMFLSERAIERHVTTIFDKLGLVASRHAHRRVLAVLAY